MVDRRGRRGPKSGHTVRGWLVGNVLGEGGNGIVYEAERDNVAAAIKFLVADLADDQARTRFRHEIEAMRLCQDMPGILPVLDDNVADAESSTGEFWLVMPRATPPTEWRKDIQTLPQAVEVCLVIARILEELHRREIAHRDVKPGNILRYEGRWVLGDLGLADFPGKEEVTVTGEIVGPRFYMAPEMLRAKDVGNAHPADVYALAKVLWTLGARQNHPPPGWQPVTVEGTRLSANVVHPRARLLDPVIDKATRHEPRERPNMNEFATELDTWLNPPAPPPLPDPTDRLAAAVAVFQAAIEKQTGVNTAITERNRQYTLARDWEAEQRNRIAELLIPVMAEFGELLVRYIPNTREQQNRMTGKNDIIGAVPSGMEHVRGATLRICWTLDINPATMEGVLKGLCSIERTHLKAIWSHPFPAEGCRFIIGGAGEAAAVQQFAVGGREAIVQGIELVARIIEGLQAGEVSLPSGATPGGGTPAV